MDTQPENPEMTTVNEPLSEAVPVSAAPGANRSAVMLNRVALLLGFVGVFIAGVLSLGHFLALQIPCGENHGCDTVALDPHSVIFNIPVAYLGLGAYVTLAGISALRGMLGLTRTKPIGLSALIVSGGGALFSFYLQYVALTEIKAFCIWCLASAIVMCLMFLVQAALAQIELEPESGSRRDVDFGFTVVLAALCVLGIGYQSRTFIHTAPKLDLLRRNLEQELLTADSIKLGPDSAPVKVIEFSDLLCGACRATYPHLKAFMDKSNNKVQLIFRHYPLYKNEDHAMSLPSAFVAEYADEKGKAWPFIEAIYKVDQDDLQNLDEVMKVAKSVGLDTTEIQARMKDNDPAYQRVTRDIDTAHASDFHETPTFVLLAPGVQPVALLSHDLINTLNKPQYQQFIKANTN